MDISIHASREGCDWRLPSIHSPGGQISIHASREGCDDIMGIPAFIIYKFQSTHPARDATFVVL